MTDTGSANPTLVAIRFNDSINGRDTDGLASLMSDDHTFVDSQGAVVSGKRGCLDAWRGFFESFPDYRNVFASLAARDDVVTAVGHSVCSEPSLAGPALWTARIRNDKVVEWRVYADTPEVREQLGVQNGQ
ncbi:nuclear transport factor 2 family protein [Streptomyces sp. NPDC060065]|uniref:nuclear transport factor 2 family protein n=1 Tax=Streptomyces sp. NPDC060065 TaxID=3347050 RepID=UPI0036C95656